MEAVKRAHRDYAKRQLTWMRKMPGIELIDRTGRDDPEVAREVLGRLARSNSFRDAMRFEKWQALGNDYVILAADDLTFELTPERIRRICAPHFGYRLRRRPAALATAMTPRWSPSFESSTRTARRRSCRATGLARPCSTCVTAAGRIGTILDPHQGGADPPDDHRTGLGDASRWEGRRLASPDFPSGGADGTGTSNAGGRDFGFQHVSIGNPQCVIDAGEEVEELDLAAIGPEVETSRCSRTAPTCPSSASRAPLFAPGSSSAEWGRPCHQGPAPAGPPWRPSCAASRARSPWCSTAVTLTVEISDQLEVRLTGTAQRVFGGELSPELIRELRSA